MKTKVRFPSFMALCAFLVVSLAGCDMLRSWGFIAPDTPSGLSVGDETASTLALSWSEAAGATSYQVFRSTSASGPWTEAAYDGGSTGFTDKDLMAETVYYYAVQASNEAGSSSLSTAVGGTTLATAVPETTLSTNAFLASAVLEGATGVECSLSPAFGSTTFSYSATANSSYLPYTLTLTVEDSHATITSVDPITAQMDDCYTLDLALGTTTDVTVEVTAQDGTTTETYTFAIMCAVPVP